MVINVDSDGGDNNDGEDDNDDDDDVENDDERNIMITIGCYCF